tara:strand:- start:654 stop:899 length:246 start_codon:yes stop_codon:yes gene_type:complete
MNCDLSATERNSSAFPKVGDIIGCNDGDIGVVISTKEDPYYFSKERIVVEARWINAGLCTDAWCSEDFNTGKEMFHVISRA